MIWNRLIFILQKLGLADFMKANHEHDGKDGKKLFCLFLTVIMENAKHVQTETESRGHVHSPSSFRNDRFLPILFYPLHQPLPLASTLFEANPSLNHPIRKYFHVQPWKIRILFPCNCHAANIPQMYNIHWLNIRSVFKFSVTSWWVSSFSTFVWRMIQIL